MLREGGEKQIEEECSAVVSAIRVKQIVDKAGVQAYFVLLPLQSGEDVKAFVSGFGALTSPDRLIAKFLTQDAEMLQGLGRNDWLGHGRMGCRVHDFCRRRRRRATRFVNQALTRK